MKGRDELEAQTCYPLCGRQKHNCHEFRANQGYIVSSRITWLYDETLPWKKWNIKRNKSYSSNSCLFQRASPAMKIYLLSRSRPQRESSRRPVLEWSDCSQSQLSWSSLPRMTDMSTFTLPQWTIRSACGVFMLPMAHPQMRSTVCP